ncbi:MAG: M48 family metalloprotease [Alphaproteobacteria bacterium]
MLTFRRPYGTTYGSRGPGKGRFILGLIIALIAILSYFMSAEDNPITGERQYVSLSPHQEIAMGLQAAPHMASQYGGLSTDTSKQQLVDKVGHQLVTSSVARQTSWKYEFHVLADSQVLNAFALPGGQIFITEGLLNKLSMEDEVAAVLSHEMVHVIARHGAQHMAKQQLASGLSGAAVIATGEYGAGEMAALIGQMVNMKYGREDELESDMFGVRLMLESGYDPQAMISVMQILQQASQGNRQPEFFSTHPNPTNRIGRIKEAIAHYKDK